MTLKCALDRLDERAHSNLTLNQGALRAVVDDEHDKVEIGALDHAPTACAFLCLTKPRTCTAVLVRSVLFSSLSLSLSDRLQDNPPVLAKHPWLAKAVPHLEKYAHFKFETCQARLTERAQGTLNCMWQEIVAHSHALLHHLEHPFQRTAHRPRHKHLEKFATQHHTGNFVWSGRGADATQVWEAMPMYAHPSLIRSKR